MSWWMVVGIAVVLLVVAGWWLRQRRPSGGATNDDGDRLDTLAAWPPTATRVLTSAERLGYGVLVRAMPGHMVLAQVPLARFLKVPTRHSYSEWLRRLGSQCADLVVCDMASEVIAIVTIQPPADRVSERARKRQLRMARVLKKAGIPLHVWTDAALPSPEAAREMILPKVAPATELAPAAPPPRTQERPTRPTPFDDSQRDSAQDEMIEVREPPPSTWFDEFNSGPAPLQSRDKRR
jgi:hypothetical protein